MNRVKLGEMLTFQRGYDLTHSQMKGGSVPVVGSSEIIGWHDKMKVKAPALLIGRSGTVGRPQFYNLDIWAHNTTLFVSDFHGNDPLFSYYFLQNLNLENYANSSGVPTLNRNFIHPLMVNFPDPKSQRAISKILSALDKKIELNKSINSELEAMVKTIYDYWFVQFDFPDENGKPYKSNGGKMVRSEELKREIPEGWDVLELKDIIYKTGTGLNPRNNFKLGSGHNFYITIKNVKNNKIVFDDTCDRVDDEALRIIDRRSDLQVGDVLFTSIEPVGVTYLIHKKPRNWNINESVFTVRPNYEKISSEYLYILLSSDEMKAFTTNVSAGSVHRGIRHTLLKTFKLPYKDKQLVEKFTLKISPILKRIYLLDTENQKLAELRDWLLPMLMNGQVSVK